jgi:CDP-archaeol synthase
MPRAPWVFLPVLGAPLAHAPVLRLDLLRGLKRPIDGGTGVFGDNKTWRGAVVMFAGAFAATQALWRVAPYRARLPAELATAPPAAVGAALGVGVVAGELPNSFLKRRLGIAPGSRRRTPFGIALSIYDQADWVPLTALLLRPAYRMPPRDVASAFAVVAAVHVPINLIGYALGARRTPL